MGRRKRGRARPVGWPGRLLARLPAGSPLLYPLYLAAQLDTAEETYASPRWPRALDGLRLAYLSDIHYGSLLGEARVRSLAERVNALEADVILLGGDYGEDTDGAARFFALKPGFRARYFVAAALGNHDRIQPEEHLPPLMDAMRADGVIPLVNGAEYLQKDGCTAAFVTVDDYYNGAPDLRRAAELARGADFTVFFPHSPDILPQTLADGPFYQLALCGHTHGGQVALLGHSLHSSSDLGDRYRSGWYREAGADILVSNGVGTSVLPVRLGARPQIHLLVMRHADA